MSGSFRHDTGNLGYQDTGFGTAEHSQAYHGQQEQQQQQHTRSSWQQSTGHGVDSVNPTTAFPVTGTPSNVTAAGSSDFTGTPVGLLAMNLPFRVRWQDLKDLCREIAPVIRAEVALEPDGRSRGFGEVYVGSREDAELIRSRLDHYDWHGRRIRIHLNESNESGSATGLPIMRPGSLVPSGAGGTATPPADVDERVVFVGNLPWTVQWQDLKDLLRPAGRILRADVSTGPDGRSRGWGTALFATEQEAQAAIDRFDNFEISGRLIRLRKDRLGGRGAPTNFAPRPASHPQH
ncbi:hypothetical protein PYCC9005_003872 [Savitreella phatthalungensis]